MNNTDHALALHEYWGKRYHAPAHSVQVYQVAETTPLTALFVRYHETVNGNYQPVFEGNTTTNHIGFPDLALTPSDGLSVVISTQSFYPWPAATYEVISYTVAPAQASTDVTLTMAQVMTPLASGASLIVVAITLVMLKRSVQKGVNVGGALT